MRAIGAWVLALLLGLAVTEVLVRTLDLFAPARRLVAQGELVAEDEGAPAARALLHPFRGWQLRPGRAVGAEYLELMERTAPGEPEPRPRNPRRVLNRFGFRSNVDDYRTLPRDDLVVGVTGGSVASMFAVRGGAALEAELARRLDLPADRVHVVNLATGGYKQPQQLAVLSEMLLLGVPLDAVINLDGFNEVVLGQVDAEEGRHPYFPSHSHLTTLLQLARAAPNPQRIVGWAELLAARERAAGWLHWGRDSASAAVLESARALAGALAQRDLDRARRLEAALSESADESGDAAVSAELDDPCLHATGGCLDLVVDLWARASLAMAHLADSAGIVYLHALQPNQYVPGTKPLNAEEHEKAFSPSHPWARAAARGYPALIARGRDLARAGVAWADLTGVFAGRDETIYIDPCCHIDVEGNRILAEALAGRLAPLLASRRTAEPSDVVPREPDDGSLKGRRPRRSAPHRDASLPPVPIERLPASTSAERLTGALARDGCAVVERVVPAATMRRARDELAPWLEATPLGRDDFAGRRTRRTGGLVARSLTCRELLQHPLVIDTARLLLTGATSVQLHLTQVIAIGPGEPGQPIHRDQWAFDFFPFPKGYEVQCNTIWAMSDFTASNGATRVVPGSHLYEDRLQLQHGDCEVAEMSAGSVFVYTGAVYHGGGENRSSETRYGLNLTYARSWLRQEENQYLSVPFEVARGLPDELLRLIGYQRGAYALGYVDDIRDPLDVLRGTTSGHRGGELGDLEGAAAKLRGGR